MLNINMTKLRIGLRVFLRQKIERLPIIALNRDIKLRIESQCIERTFPPEYGPAWGITPKSLREIPLPE